MRRLNMMDKRGSAKFVQLKYEGEQTYKLVRVAQHRYSGSSIQIVLPFSFSKKCGRPLHVIIRYIGKRYTFST